MTGWFDPGSATLDRRVFSDPAIHALELERVFATSWQLVGPANWLLNAGDWISARLGAELVAIWRDRAGGLQGVVDLCPCCQRPLSTGERGSAAPLACPIHPQARGFARVPHLTERNGLVFANMDCEALPMMFEPDPIAVSRLIAVGEHRLRWTFAGNWKLAMEHFCSAIDMRDRVHAASDLPRRTSATQFPNLTFDPASSSLQVWHPAAPDRTEVDTWCVVAHDATEADRDAARRATQRAWGPGGLLAQDLAPHWQSITETSKGLLARRHRLPIEKESGQRAFYAWWHHRLTAANTRPRRSIPLSLRAV